MRQAFTSLRPYGEVLLAVAVATTIRQMLDPWLPRGQTFSWYYLAVVVSAWCGGWRRALLAGALGYVAADWFFIEPRYSILGSLSGRFWSGLASYASVCTAIAVCTHALRRQAPALVFRFDLDNTLELLDVASAIRMHGIGPSELPEYLEGLNASPSVYRLALSFSRREMTPSELAGRLEAFVKRSSEVAEFGGA